MFLKPARKQKKKKVEEVVEQKENVFVDRLSDDYLEYSLSVLDENNIKNVLKGKFPKLKYTLSGFDPDDLPYKEKVYLLTVLYELNVKDFGRKKARVAIENLGIKIKERLGIIDEFEKGLRDLPTGVFELQKIKYLAKEDLEEKLLECLLALDAADALIEKNVKVGDSDLLSQKTTLESVLYNTTDGVFSLDLHGAVATFNATMETLTGYSFEEVRGKSVDEFVRLFDKSEPLETKVYCPILTEFKDRNVYTSERLTLITRNGTKKYVRMISSTITEGREVDIGCIVTLSDISKEIELESMKLDFVSMAAHELRTPITSVRGYLSLLSDEGKDSLEEKYQEYLEKAIVNSDRLHILVENLLSISKIERGAMLLNLQKESWTALVKSMVGDFAETADTHGIKVSFIESKSTIPKVLVDSTMIMEVLSNLLDNAIRYTDSGGRVSVFIEESAGMVTTHVKDTGIGIPQASLPHVFKKFYRVSTVLKEGRKGTGLGLFISQEIIKMHHGKIWVESVEGKGSTFSFSVPIYKNNKKNNE